MQGMWSPIRKRANREWELKIEVKKLCIKMYLNGMGFRGIERVTEIHHTTILNWVKEMGIQVAEE